MKYLLIGAGESLKTKQMGDTIDSYDITVRFNYSGSQKIVNETNKNVVGLKQDYWFCLQTNRLVFNNLQWASKYKKIFIEGLSNIPYVQWMILYGKTYLPKVINSPKKYNLIKKITQNKPLCLFNLTKNNYHKNIYILPYNWGKTSKIITKIIEKKFPDRYNITTGLQALYYIIKHEKTYPPKPPPLPPTTPTEVLEKYNNSENKCYNDTAIHLCGFDGFKTGHFYKNKFIKRQKWSDNRSLNGKNLHYGKGEQHILKKLEKTNKVAFI